MERKLHLSKVIQSSLHMYPVIDPSSELSKPPLSPSLCTLVEQSGDIIPLELLADVQESIREFRRLHTSGSLAK